MYPGLTDTDCRIAEMHLREVRAEAHWRRLGGPDAAGHPTTGGPGALRRLGAAGAGLVALLAGRRAGGKVGQAAPALREGTAS